MPKDDDLGGKTANNLPILCLDFDGVLHSYLSGWKGATIIPDPPVLGMWEFLESAKEHFEIIVHSSRCAHEGGEEAILFWLYKTRKEWREKGGMHYTNEPLKISVSKEKPPAYITLDDRAITFKGQWPTIESLLSFRPWHKEPK